MAKDTKGNTQTGTAGQTEAEQREKIKKILLAAHRGTQGQAEAIGNALLINPAIAMAIGREILDSTPCPKANIPKDGDTRFFGSYAGIFRGSPERATGIRTALAEAKEAGITNEELIAAAIAARAAKAKA